MAHAQRTSPIVIGGIDTHKDLHAAAVVDRRGTVLATELFSTTRAGYRALLRWMRSFGDVRQVGVEGTGSYGASVARHLLDAGIEVFEITRPDRSDRRLRGKSDTFDAEAAARAVLDGRRISTPKDKSGKVESLRVLRLTRTAAVRARTKALQLMRNHIISAPDEVRAEVRSLTRMQLIRTCARWRPDLSGYGDPATATRIALKSLARRYLLLNDEVGLLDELIETLVRDINPALLELCGFGIENAGQLLVTAGDNTDRLRSEPAFAMLCGVAPLPASSGKVKRHRLNRGGDRAANSALHMAVMCRLRIDPRTQAYASRRLDEGLSKREIVRCLKRYLAREVFTLLKSSGLDIT